LKKKLFLFLFILILVLGGILFYYLFPISANSVIPYSENISSVDFGYYIEEGNVEKLSTQIMDPAEINELISIFESTSYTRTFGSTNIKNNVRLISMTIFYFNSKGNLNNYDVDINDSGYIVSNNKKYKIKEEKKGMVFNRLYDWLIKK
jgi:hypothetical protein